MFGIGLTNIGCAAASGISLSIAITSPIVNANVMLNSQTASTGAISQPGTTATTITGTISNSGTVVVKLGSTTLGSAIISGLNWSYSWTPTLAQLGSAQTLNATVTATIGGATANASGVLINVAMIGQVGSRTTVPGAASASLAYNFRQAEHNRTGQSLAGIGVSMVNGFVSTSGVETTSGGTLTYNGTIEYPSGTVIGNITWNGVSSVTVAELAVQHSDITPVPSLVPPDAVFFVNMRIIPNGAAKTPYTSAWGGINTALGDGVVQTSSDLTNSPATIAAGGNGLGGTNELRCAAIFGVHSTRKAIILLGDSRQGATGDLTVDSTGNEGEIPRALGQVRPILNVGRGSDERQWFVASHAFRAPFSNLCAVAIDAYGINDFRTGSRTSAQFLADGVTVRTLLALPYYQCTPMMASVGAWTLADGSDQAVNSTINTPRVTACTAIRAGIVGDAGFHEIAWQLELTHDVGKWKADGTTNKYTGDGLHETTFANQSLVLTPP